MATAEVELTTAKVSKRRGKQKQDDLPTMEEHQRKIQEIEDLGDIEQETADALSDAKEKHNDAMENLVASMKRHDKAFYARPTWSKVVLKESKTKAKVTKATAKTAEDDSDPSDSAAE